MIRVYNYMMAGLALTGLVGVALILAGRSPQGGARSLRRSAKQSSKAR